MFMSSTGQLQGLLKGQSSGGALISGEKCIYNMVVVVKLGGRRLLF